MILLRVSLLVFVIIGLWACGLHNDDLSRNPNGDNNLYPSVHEDPPFQGQVPTPLNDPTGHVEVERQLLPNEEGKIYHSRER
ncbi:hypothetical protein GCM10008967_03640 [Bacillus carboniphilus]|uniref:Secreted protein n=1 Tax=Bacillus carboniphilus TaxID=86663 RepID=A0ABN0VSQ5_9BACI